MTNDAKILLLIFMCVFSGVTTIFILGYAHKCFKEAKEAFKELRKLKDKLKM